METMQGKQNDDGLAGRLILQELNMLSRTLEQSVLLLRSINSQLAYSSTYLRDILEAVTDEAWEDEPPQPQEPEGRSELELAQSRQPADLDLDMDWGSSPF